MRTVLRISNTRTLATLAVATMIATVVLLREPSVVEVLSPAGTQHCVNVDAGFSVDVPAGWHTWGAGHQSCALFDPDPIDPERVFLPDWSTMPNQHPRTALQIAAYDESPFEYVLERLTTGAFETVLSKKDARVDGRRAVVLETRATGAGFYEKGARAYWYIIDNDGFALMVSTVAQHARAGRYAEFKRTVDLVVTSLSFEGRRDLGRVGRIAGFIVLVAPLLVARLRQRRGNRKRL